MSETKIEEFNRETIICHIYDNDSIVEKQRLFDLILELKTKDTWALEYATEINDLPLVEHLMLCKFECTKRAILNACIHDDADIVKKLIVYYLRFNSTDKKTTQQGILDSLLVDACELNNNTAVCLLFELGAKLTESPKNEEYFQKFSETFLEYSKRSMKFRGWFTKENIREFMIKSTDDSKSVHNSPNSSPQVRRSAVNFADLTNSANYGFDDIFGNNPIYNLDINNNQFKIDSNAWNVTTEDNNDSEYSDVNSNSNDTDDNNNIDGNNYENDIDDNDCEIDYQNDDMSNNYINFDVESNHSDYFSPNEHDDGDDVATSEDSNFDECFSTEPNKTIKSSISSSLKNNSKSKIDAESLALVFKVDNHKLDKLDPNLAAFLIDLRTSDDKNRYIYTKMMDVLFHDGEPVSKINTSIIKHP